MRSSFRIPRSHAFFCLLLWAWAGANAANTQVVRHNMATTDNENPPSYKVEVLRLILDKSAARYGPATLATVGQERMTQTRAFRELDAGRLDVVATMTNHEREKASIPVRYCLYKGLLGVRIGMGKQSVVDTLEAIRTQEALAGVELGNVFDWPDYAIQQSAGLKVVRLTDFQSGIYRIKHDTLQLMPLGVVEVGPIAREEGLATISSWAIAYPTAYYFFVGRHNPKLAERLAYGFEAAIRDKSLDALFNRMVGPAIAAVGLEQRRLFRFPNPTLPKETPLHRAELWHPLVVARLKPQE